MIPIRDQAQQHALEDVLQKAGYKTRITKIARHEGLPYLLFGQLHAPMALAYDEEDGFSIYPTDGDDLKLTDVARVKNALDQAVALAERLKPLV